MHIIGFSHHYTKLWGQTRGELLAVRRVTIDADYPQAAIAYDTEFLSDEKNEDGVPYKDFYPLPHGDYLLLVFLGNRAIPFTTYRKIPENYTRWMSNVWDEDEMKDEPPYAELVGQLFAFKFKGEPLPPGTVVPLGEYHCVPDVRIFD